MHITDFLAKHAALLDHVSDAQSRREWHRAFAQDWGPHASSLAASANATFGLSGATQIRPDVGYLVAESAPEGTEKSIILLSVNPGWVEEVNVRERAFKGQEQVDAPIELSAFENYRSHLFPTWYEQVVRPVRWQRGMWWNHALNFLHDVAGYPRVPRMCGLDARLHVLGWELWPMQSSSDGLTGAVKRAPAATSLEAFAKASIRAALRTPADQVVVASSIGFDFISQLGLRELETATATVEDTIEGIKVRSWSLPNGKRLVAVRRQLFAGFGRPSRETMQRIVTFCRAQSGAGGSRVSSTTEKRVAERGASAPVAGERITLRNWSQDDDHLIWVRNISGSAQHDLEPLDGDEDEVEVHTRLGGYWRLNVRGHGRGADLCAALEAGKRVFILGKVGDEVVRVVEVTEDPFLPPAGIETTRTETFRAVRPQPAVLTARPSGRAGWRWATLFEAEPTGRHPRVRLHTTSVDDGDWRGRKLEGDGVRVQNPGFFATDAALPDVYVR